jgi:sodium pump decarboxylase gamma subunit
MESTAQLIDAGITVTLIGMSVVFVLLTALVGIISAMSWLCSRIAPATTPAAAPDPDDEIVSVIAAGITQYRRSRAP